MDPRAQDCRRQAARWHAELRLRHFFFFSSRRRHTRLQGDWSSDVCSSDLRAALYDLGRDPPPPLVARSDVVAVAERTGPAGVLEPLGQDEVVRVVAAVRALAPPPEALAVALLFAFRHAEHERRLVAALRDALPDIPIAASHEVLPVFREFERASTTTVEAYLRPKVSAYLGRLERDVRARGIGMLRVMTSSGGDLPPGAAATRAASPPRAGPGGGWGGPRSGVLRPGRGPTHRHRRVLGAAMARRPASARGRGAARSRCRGACAPLSRSGRGGERAGRDRGRYRGGGGGRNGARAQAGQRGPRARSPANGPTPVRRRRAAVRVPAGRGAGDAHYRDPAPPGSPLGAGPRLGRGTGRSARVVSPPARGPVVPGPQSGVRPSAQGGAESGARRRPAALRRLPVRRAGLRSDRAGDGRRSAADAGRISRRAPRAVRPCGERPGDRAREPARGRAARGAGAAVR